MIVIILEKVSPSVRGYVSRWLIEPKAGVFVGKVSALVRDLLWNKLQTRIGKGSAVQIWSTNNEQGFDIRMIGDRKRVVVENEGLKLIKTLKTLC